MAGHKSAATSNRSTKIEWIAVPVDLRDLVHSFYTLEVGPDGVDEPVPAYSAQLSIIIEGEFEVHRSSGDASRARLLHLEAPQLEAGRMVSTGSMRGVAASLTPLGWAALTAKPVNKVHDCHVAWETFAESALIERVQDWAGQPGARDQLQDTGVGLLEAILHSAPHKVKPRHREFVKAMNAWLASEFSPPIETLYERMPLSSRQCQRLSSELFGASPSQVLMRHRAIRAAMLLSNRDLPQALRDELDVAYFDQAHMIRDIRRFTGRTPAGLSEHSLSQQSLDPMGHGATAVPMRINGTE